MSLNNKKLAVLIDADNAPADIIDEMLEEIAKYGVASVKRIYGDWSHGLNKWKAALLPHAIIPVQQFAYTKGKNSTDMALVIDAMDLLYSGNFDGFCIVSSDSDFTRLASRIRESGLTVYGFGEKKTPESFRRACDKFVYVEIFRPEKHPPKQKIAQALQQNKSKHNQPLLQPLIDLMKRAVKENADDLGWANLGPIGSYINKVNPDFDSRLYGFSKLSDLIKSLDLFEHRTDNNQLQVRRRKIEHNSINQPKTPESISNPEPNPEPNPEDPKPQKNNPKSKKSSDKTQPDSLKTTTQLDLVAHQPESPASGSLKNEKRVSFTKIIPIVQAAVDACADVRGWARLGNLIKHLETQIEASQYGFQNLRDLIHAIYADWLEIKKIGRGERVRVNKRFVSKESSFHNQPHMTDN